MSTAQLSREDYWAGVPLGHLAPICNPAQSRQSVPWDLDGVLSALSEPGSSALGWWVSLQITGTGGTVSLKILVSQRQDFEMSPVLELTFNLFLAKYSTIFQVELCRALGLAQQDTWHLESTHKGQRVTAS